METATGLPLPPSCFCNAAKPIRRHSTTTASIPSNVAEGARRSRRPFILHLEIALGSEAEVEVQLELAHRLGFLTASEYESVQQSAVVVGRMLHRLVESLRPTKASH